MKKNKHLKVEGQIIDRGMTKWQGLMIPEHVEMIKEWRANDTKVPKPDLDEHDMQLIQEEIDVAMKRKCTVHIHTWKDGETTKHHGTIARVDTQTRTLHYVDPVKRHRLNLDEIVSVTMID